MCCEPLSGATLAKASKVFGGHLVSRVAFCCGNNYFGDRKDAVDQNNSN